MGEIQKVIDEVLGDPAVWERFAVYMHAITTTTREMAEAFSSLAISAGAACGTIFNMKIRDSLTRRQYHLYRHGRPRVRKKWENAAIRRAKKAERRKTHV